MFRTSKVRQLGIALIASMALFFSAVACSDDSSTPSQDTTSGNTDTGGGNKDGGGSDTGGGGGDAGTPATALKVAAIQFGSDQFGQVNNCGTTICALSELITNAAKNGAKIIVTPEYAFGQKTAEVSPDQGEKVIDDSRWPEGKIISSMAKLAVQLKVTVVFNAITQAGSGSSAKLYNTQLAIGEEGKVLARH